MWKLFLGFHKSLFLANKLLLSIVKLNFHSIQGDDFTNDSALFNAILQANTNNCKIGYFPYDMYMVKSMFFVLKDTRIVRKAWLMISSN